jgi:hypothetical protein
MRKKDLRKETACHCEKGAERSEGRSNPSYFEGHIGGNAARLRRTSGSLGPCPRDDKAILCMGWIYRGCNGYSGTAPACEQTPAATLQAVFRI